jgi:tripartite-type tricarboxylate transporter receptor subunit TctC
MARINKRRVFLFLVLIGLMVWPLGDVALSAEYPSKTIEWVIPWPAGGRTDIASRLIAPYLQKYIGASVVVINKVGGAGVVGYTHVRDAKPDGYTVSMGGQGLLVGSYLKPGVDPWNYTWLGRVYWTPVVLAVKGKSPFKTAKALVEYAKANPGKLRHGNTGTGNSTHIASAKFAKQFGIKLTQVPYKGEGKTVIGIGSGEVDMAFGLMAAFRPFVEDKKIHVIAVAGEKRNPLYPGIPTFREQGLNFTDHAWEGIHTPKGLPNDVYSKLSEACKKALTDPELIEKFAKIQFNVAYQSGPELTNWLKSWDKIVGQLIGELGVPKKR